MITLTELAEVLEAAAAKARELAASHRAERRDWVDQVQSPLGRKRHCLAVRQRVQRGDAGAVILGRRFLLSTEALDAEMGRASLKKVKEPSVADEALAELRWLAGGGRR